MPWSAAVTSCPWKVSLLTHYTTKHALVSSCHILSMEGQFTHSLHHQKCPGQQPSHLVHGRSVYSPTTPPNTPWLAAVTSCLWKVSLLTRYTTKNALVSSRHILSMEGQSTHPLHHQTRPG